MEGRRPNELMLALYNPEGYAVNFGLLAQSLVDEGVRLGGPRVTVEFEREVLKVEKEGEGYQITTNQGSVTTRVAVFDTDAYSLGFAKSMGLGLHFSLIPVAGSFYFSPQLLAGKVYRVQDPRMPFAAAHGDPDLTRTGQTRWGPTARFYPVLEARKLSTAPAYFRSSGLLRSATWVSFFSILLEPIRAWYLIKNFFYDLPLVGKYFFLPEVKRIVPTLKARDLAVARGYGGMRLQRVDTTTRELLLGEGKI
jgi:malate dehydrogenase (quinone)